MKEEAESNVSLISVGWLGVTCGPKELQLSRGKSEKGDL